MGTREIKWDFSPGINAIEALRAFGPLTVQVRFFFRSGRRESDVQSFCQETRHSYGALRRKR